MQLKRPKGRHHKIPYINHVSSQNSTRSCWGCFKFSIKHKSMVMFRLEFAFGGKRNWRLQFFIVGRTKNGGSTCYLPQSTRRKWFAAAKALGFSHDSRSNTNRTVVLPWTCKSGKFALSGAPIRVRSLRPLWCPPSFRQSLLIKWKPQNAATTHKNTYKF